MSSAAEEVAGVVRAINDAWTHGRTEELHRLVRPDVVQALPILRDRVTGAEAYVRGYNEFLASSVVHEFAAEEPVVDVFGSTAVATCSYTIEYEHGGRRWRGTGTDLLVLVQEDGWWKAAWRALVPGEEEEIQP